MKLWDKGYSVNSEIEKFTVGNDFLVDCNLVKYDVFGSIAHAAMLNKIGILNKNEFEKLRKCLSDIYRLDEKGMFKISPHDEDAHTAIEGYLTEKLGDLGKKIHTARSRNDQVLVDIRLYSKDKLLEVQKLALELASAFAGLAERHNDVPMPGYTHSRKAMPSSVGMYFGCFTESLEDDVKILCDAYDMNDQCPLGSGAGYGIPLNIDRKLVSDILGFGKVQNNVLYVQNSRGKFEMFAIFALGSIMNDLSRLSNDLILFSMDEFGFFSLPDEFCTGSSIMPQKKNPDVLELIRAKAAKVDSSLYLVKSILSKLPSGYSRDLQLTKEALVESFEITLASLKIFILVIKHLRVNAENCMKGCAPELFATDYAYNLVKIGIPFRDAYIQAAKSIGTIKNTDPAGNIKSKKHIGGTGNLGLSGIKSRIKIAAGENESRIKSLDKTLANLLR